MLIYQASYYVQLIVFQCGGRFQSLHYRSGFFISIGKALSNLLCS